ncbi:heterokaryon incompatibility protein-domain-containing protein [Phaeosphaeriaceae sp. PMI808]|nr:heterokaryon incompatibility protein-domain-containing protein [Phaeosphaeriaceae sp. PMI808]
MNLLDMEPKGWSSPLCVACQSITLEMFRNGFEHPLPYPRIVEMGKTCMLCRLIVCSTSHLQTLEANRYEVNRDYHIWASTLPQLPYLVRNSDLVYQENGPPFILETVNSPPWRVSWKRQWTGLQRYIKGEFNDGNTIQISAPKNSIYKSYGFFIEDTESAIKSCGFSSQDIEPANSIRNKSLLYTWLRNCVEEHPQCQKSFSGDKFDLDENMDETQPLPTRTLEVGRDNDHIRLVSTVGKKGVYIALSHRWGPRKNLRTLNGNLKDHLKKINIEDMPHTFKDAIEVTRDLGAQYLWIDSLCIIQDNEEDWAFEANQMGRIFENALCTIAAVDAIDDRTGMDRGLFIPREEDPLAVRFYCAPQKDPVKPEIFRSKAGQPYCWKYNYYSNPKESNCTANENILQEHRLIAKPRLLGSGWETMQSKWNRRGWILQERILSRRMIYFSKSKLSWDCLATSGEEESLGLGTPPLRATIFKTGIQRWQSLTENYTECSLSFDSDKLAAIAGLAERLGKKSSRPYFAGVFKDATGSGLMWRSDSNDPMTRLDSLHVPSWTWAAYNGAITYSLGTNSGMSESICEISKPDFSIKHGCPNTCPNKSRTCITGSVKWVGMIDSWL